MPTSGQLGCQGFIILDREGLVHVPKTLVFLDKGELAFRDVEFQIKCLLAKEDAVSECDFCSFGWLVS